MSSVRAQRLGRELVEAGVLDEEALGRALSAVEQDEGLSLMRALVDLGLMEDADLVAFYAHRYRMVAVDLDDSPPDPGAIELAPRALCESLGALPIALEGDVLVVAISDPHDYIPVEQGLQEVTGRRVRIVLGSERAISKRWRARGAETIQAPSEGVGGAPEDDGQVVSMLENLMQQALARGSSDIHFEPGERFTRIRFRIDGQLADIISLPLELLAPLVARVKVLSELDLAERRLPQDGNFQTDADGRSVDVRVSTMPTVWGERVCMRLLDKSTGPSELRSIGLEKDVLKAFEGALESPNGIILVTGPTGSGKTSTLYAGLRHLHQPNRNIMTVEDPVEYRIEGISQAQVNPKIGFTFASALQAFLRQDPDVILLGEIRNEDTARIAVRASLTGHLVLSTMHMHSAPEAVTRMAEMGVPPYMVSSSLKAVLAQRLVRRICRGCMTKVKLDPELAERYGFDDAFKGQGCAKCGYTGYKGRIAVNELLVVDEQLRDGINRGMTLDELTRLAQERGMRTLAETALSKVQRGKTSFAEALPFLGEL